MPLEPYVGHMPVKDARGFVKGKYKTKDAAGSEYVLCLVAVCAPSSALLPLHSEAIGDPECRTNNQKPTKHAPGPGWCWVVLGCWHRPEDPI